MDTITLYRLVGGRSIYWYDSGVLHHFVPLRKSLSESPIGYEEALRKIDNYIILSTIFHGLGLKDMLNDSQLIFNDTILFGKPLIAANLTTAFPNPKDPGWESTTHIIYFSKDAQICGEEYRLNIYGGKLRYLNLITSHHYNTVTAPSLRAATISKVKSLTSIYGNPNRIDLTAYTPPKIDSPLSINEVAPTFVGRTGEGKLSTLIPEHGRITLLDFWYAGCPPCFQLRPILSQIQKQFEKKGVHVVGIDPIDTSKIIFNKAIGSEPYEQLMASNDVVASYHVSVYPTVYLIDTQGLVKWFATGFYPSTKQDIETEINKLLNSK